jgi:hypothetical protein
LITLDGHFGPPLAPTQRFEGDEAHEIVQPVILALGNIE